MKKSWFKYYNKHQGVAPSNILLHWPYIFQIILTNSKKMLEVGCGPADHSVFLSYINPNTKISLLDNDKKIIIGLKNRLSNKISNFYICNITNKKDVLKQNFVKNEFDLIYSQGLMEHFNKDDFQTIINNFLPYTKKILISIPSENYPTLDFGNEILRNKQQLFEIIKPISNIDFKISKYFPDIGLRTKIIKIKNEKMNIVQSLLLLFLHSLHYLIEINKKS